MLAAFSPVLRADFVNLDDPFFITGNDLVRGGGPIPFRGIFSEQLFTPHYKPLVYLSWAVEQRLFGLEPFVLHLDNLLLHALNAVLVLLLTLRIFQRLAPESAHNRLAAFAAAALFALHPLRVESVAWAVQRKDVLFALFYLAALLVYVRHSEDRGVWRGSVGALLFLLALLSKQTALTLPIALLALDYLLGRRPRGRLLLEKWPYLTVLPIGLYLYGLHGLLGSGSLRLLPSAGAEAGQVAGPLSLAAGQVVSICYRLTAWIGRTLLPLDLSPAYPVPELGRSAEYPGHLWLYPVLVVAALGAAFYSSRRGRVAAFGLSFFLITISPALVLGASETTFVSDRYTYIPSIGLTIMAGAGLRWLSGRRPGAVPWVRWALAAVVLVLALATYRQAGVWKDSTTLWEYVLSRHPQTGAAWHGRGLVRQQEGDLEGAIADHREAVRLDPRHAWAWARLGDIYRSLERLEEAERAFGRSIEAAPNYTRAYNMRGLTRFALADYRGAIEDYTKALALEPGAWEVLDNRAQARLRIGDLRGALEDSLRASRLQEATTAAPP